MGGRMTRGVEGVSYWAIRTAMVEAEPFAMRRRLCVFNAEQQTDVSPLAPCGILGGDSMEREQQQQQRR